MPIYKKLKSKKRLSLRKFAQKRLDNKKPYQKKIQQQKYLFKKDPIARVKSG